LLVFAVSFVALSWLATVSAIPTAAYRAENPPPYSICTSTALANQGVLEASLGPAGGASVTAGASVIFTAHSESQPTFAIASSPALLASPDIDSGPGSALSEPSSSGPPVVYAYTFTSTKASATLGTVYWDASFSSAGIAACAGLTPATYTTQVRTLTVLPGPAPTPTPTPTPTPLAEPPPLQVSINAPAVFHLAHSAVTYAIHCTTSCSGNTSYEAFTVRRHAKPVHVRKLDLGPTAVSIADASGGEERFTHRYRGHALHLLESLLAKNGVVELSLVVHVKDASGSIARAQDTTRLHA
jgi:hypothetical protein